MSAPYEEIPENPSRSRGAQLEDSRLGTRKGTLTRHRMISLEQ